MSYIHFVDAGESKSGLTKIWYVKSDAGVSLGTISWYAPWRKYCFHPNGTTTFDEKCLHEIGHFCYEETVIHAS
jgi:hypothetical protein